MNRMKGVELTMMSKGLSENEKKFVKEISTCNDLTYLKNRYDLLVCAYNFCKVYGHNEYYKRYAMLSCYTMKELMFYKELLKQRIELLEIYAKREEKQYKELNLI